MSLKVVNLSKRFGDKWVLRDISLEVPDGEVFGIVGAAGAGKTTLLRAIKGAIPVNGGEISIGSTLRPVTYSETDPNIPIWNRLFGKKSSDESRLRDLIALIDSARGLLLIDDPYGRLEPIARETVVSAILRARERGLTVIFATRDFEQVLAVCDRAAVLAGTELKQTGTPQELYENPGSRLVAVTTGRCNLFLARRLSSSKAGIPEFHTIEGGHRLFARSVERSTLGAIHQNVTLGIRPEHISISFGASFPADNLMRATIAGVRFLGPTTLIHLDSNGLGLQALVLRLVGLNVNDECVVGLPIDKIHIFRD